MSRWIELKTVKDVAKYERRIWSRLSYMMKEQPKPEPPKPAEEIIGAVNVAALQTAGYQLQPPIEDRRRPPAVIVNMAALTRYEDFKRRRWQSERAAARAERAAAKSKKRAKGHG